MELNPLVFQILKEHNIDKSQGLLCLLGIYYKLDVNSTCTEETIKAINITKIVVKDYDTQIITWNVSLFKGHETEWDWVATEYNKKWGKNMSRKDGNADVVKRMQDFFAKYPSYRRADVMKATENYFATVRDPQYLKSSAKFIFDGVGAMKKSMLLGWCEKLATTPPDNSDMRGRVVS